MDMCPAFFLSKWNFRFVEVYRIDNRMRKPTQTNKEVRMHASMGIRKVTQRDGRTDGRRYRTGIFVRKYINCWQAAAFFSIHERMFLKVSKFLRQKMSPPRGDVNPQTSNSSRMMPLPFVPPGPEFRIQWFGPLVLVVQIVLFVKLTFEISPMHRQ